eukprot:GFYU01005733.1.p1 GENE.GFYU01005733.1~~GFYU01005733.1.p1  ORF type:complete len:113 (-),score=37.80 GFYU01005733.1:205-543(-)
MDPDAFKQHFINSEEMKLKAFKAEAKGMSDLFHKLTVACHIRCQKKETHAVAELEENECLDVCSQKFFAIHTHIGMKMFKVAEEAQKAQAERQLQDTQAALAQVQPVESESE